MTKLSMHESLPFDEATTPSPVSTGELPQLEEVRRRRHRGLRALPRRTATAPSPTTSRCWRRRIAGLFGICVVGARGRSFEIGDVETAFSIQSVSKPFVFALVCEAIGYETARQRLGVNSTGFPFNSLMAVELNDDRTMNPLVNAGCDRHHEPGARRHGGGEVGADPRRAVALRRPRAHRERGGLRLRVGHQPAQPGHRPPAARATGGSTSTPTRPPTSTPGSARST